MGHGHAEKECHVTTQAVVCLPATEPGLGSPACDTLPSGVWPPEGRGKYFLLLKPAGQPVTHCYGSPSPNVQGPHRHVSVQSTPRSAGRAEGSHSIKGEGQLPQQAQEVGPSRLLPSGDRPGSPFAPAVSAHPTCLDRLPPRVLPDGKIKESLLLPGPSFLTAPVHTDQQLLNPRLLLTSCSGLGFVSCGQTASRAPRPESRLSSLSNATFGPPPATRLAPVPAARPRFGMRVCMAQKKPASALRAAKGGRLLLPEALSRRAGDSQASSPSSRREELRMCARLRGPGGDYISQKAVRAVLPPRDARLPARRGGAVRAAEPAAGAAEGSGAVAGLRPPWRPCPACP